MGTREDVLIRAARLICTTDIPCVKHLEQARKVRDLFEAAARLNEATTREPLWALAEGEAE